MTKEEITRAKELDLLTYFKLIEPGNGRMVRQGNMNKEVSIFIYITEATFDAYSYQLVENKQKFISQIMTSKSPARSCEDSDVPGTDP